MILIGNLEKDQLLSLDEKSTFNLTCAIDQTVEGFLICEKPEIVNIDEELNKLFDALEFIIKDSQVKLHKEFQKGEIFNKPSILHIILYNVIYVILQRIPVRGELTISGGFLEGKYVIIIKDTGFQYNINRVAKDYPQRDESLLLRHDELKELMTSHNIMMQCLIKGKVNTTELCIQDFEEGTEEVYLKGSNVISLFNK